MFDEVLVRPRAALFLRHCAVLAFGCFLALASAHADGPDQKTAREGGEDLVKNAVFDAFDHAVGESGGAIVEIGGAPGRLTGGKILGAVSDVLIDPLVDAATTEGTSCDKFEAWLTPASIG